VRSIPLTLLLASSSSLSPSHTNPNPNDTLIERLYRSVGRGVHRHLLPRVLVTDLRENLGYMSFENDRQSVAGYQLRGGGDGDGDGDRNEDLSHVWGGAVTRRQSSTGREEFQAAVSRQRSHLFLYKLENGCITV